MMKILDNSVITAMGREITSVQLASVILSRYDV